jgi:hypothetical protein
VSRSAFGTLALLLLWPCTVLGQVTTAQYDNARTSAYTTEAQLTPRSVNPASFGKIHVIHVDGDVYAQVLYLPSVNIPSKGTHAVIYVATEHNSRLCVRCRGACRAVVVRRPLGRGGRS